MSGTHPTTLNRRAVVGGLRPEQDFVICGSNTRTFKKLLYGPGTERNCKELYSLAQNQAHGLVTGIRSSSKPLRGEGVTMSYSTDTSVLSGVCLWEYHRSEYCLIFNRVKQRGRENLGRSLSMGTRVSLLSSLLFTDT